MRKIRDKKSAGFTFFEVLVVVFIIGFISATFVVNWRTNEKQYRLQRTAQLVVQGIRKVQHMALASKRVLNQSSGILEIPDGGYSIYVDLGASSATSYILFADFNGNANLDSGEEIETIETEGGIIIDFIKYDASTRGAAGATPNFCYIFFSPPDSLLELKPPIPPADEIILTIKKQGGEDCSQSCEWGEDCSNDPDCVAVKTTKTGWVSIID